MKQVVYSGAGELSVRSGSAAQLGPGEVRVSIAYTGVCGTDLHIVHGAMDARVTSPTVIGHEMSGRVAELGPDVGGWQVGEAVTVVPLDPCGSCPACESGLSHICHQLNFIGIDSDGGMQESMVVSADALIRIPEGLDLRTAALTEPTAVASHDVARSRLQAGERALVVGAGPIGVLIALVARNTGAEVMIAEPDQFRREAAGRYGFETIDPVAEDVVDRVNAWTGDKGADVCFEVSSSQAGLSGAVQALACRGRLCLVGIHTEERKVDLHRFFWRELELIAARLYERSDFETALQLLDSGIIPADDLITSVVPIDEASSAFDLLGQGASMKVLVQCGDN